MWRYVFALAVLQKHWEVHVCSGLEQVVIAEVFSVRDLPMWSNVHPSSTVSQDGDTALMIAASNGHSSVVKKFLHAGVTVNTTKKVQ